MALHTCRNCSMCLMLVRRKHDLYGIYSACQVAVSVLLQACSEQLLVVARSLHGGGSIGGVASGAGES